MENNDKLNNQELKEDLYKILDRNIVWINHADQKAAIIFAAISFLFAGSVMLNDVEIFISGFSQYNFWKVAFVLIVILYGISFLLTLGLSFMVLITRTKSNSRDNPLYFMDVSEYDLPNFEKKLHEISTEEFNKLLIEQVYQTSKIASKKYMFLKYAYISIIATMILLVILTIVIALN